jgi:hypothetical protein
MTFSNISKNNSEVEVHIFNMMDQKNREQGMDRMRDEIEKSNLEYLFDFKPTKM